MKLKSIILSMMCIAAVACTNNAVPGTEYDADGVVNRVDTTKNVVYLVFTAHFSANDEGYFENFDGIVPCLDILKEKGVKGSFFPTGACFSQPKYADAIRRIVDEGHYLAHHSDKHLYLVSDDDHSVSLVTEDSLRADIADVELKLAQFGVTKDQMPWMIPPYESCNKFSADILRDLGYKLVNPTKGIITGHDWTTKEQSSYMSAADMLRTIWNYENEHTLNGCVILVHAMVYPGRDDNDRIFTHLGEIIDHIRDLGYEFGTFADVQVAPL